MFEFFMALAMTLSIGIENPDINQIVTEQLGLSETELLDLSSDGNDTTGFSDAEILYLDSPQAHYFSNRFDYDYYKFNVTQSGYYNLSVICTYQVYISIYFSGPNNNYTPTLYTSYSELSSNSNFGYNNGFYVDANETSYVYFEIFTYNRVPNQYYLINVSQFISRAE